MSPITAHNVGDEHEKLLDERGAEYGDAYARTDTWVRQNLTELAASPSPLGLIMVHFKLERALHSPSKHDHYDDIIGYAKLVLRSLEQPANHWLVDKEDFWKGADEMRDAFKGPGTPDEYNPAWCKHVDDWHRRKRGGQAELDEIASNDREGPPFAETRTGTRVR